MAERYELNQLEVHVVCVDLNRASAGLPGLYERLSADERERAARFRIEKHRSRFVVGRAVLRGLLGRYTGRDPEAIQFIYGPNGKPSLSDHTLHFNASHSEDRALYAFSQSHSLGVDIEFVRELPDFGTIAAKFFSPVENAQYRAEESAHKTAAFFRCWTRKEAFIKATGDGLSYPLDQFDVSLGHPARLLAIGGDGALASEWSLYHLTPAAGYIGALAIRGHGFDVRCYEGSELRDP